MLNEYGSAGDPGLYSGITVLLFFALLGVVLLSLTGGHQRTLKFQQRLFLYALFLRFCVSIAIYTFGLVRILGDEDSSGWVGGAGLYRQWQDVGLLGLPNAILRVYERENQGYYYLLGLLFYFTDFPTRLSAAALNCFFGAMTVVFSYRIARICFSEWVANRAGWLCCFMPSLVAWSAQTVKEPAVIFLESVVLYACLRLRASGATPRHLVLCFVGIVALLPFRFYAAYIIAMSAIFAVFFPRLTGRRIEFTSAMPLGALFALLVILSGVLAQHETRMLQFDLSFVERFRHGLVISGTSGIDAGYALRSGGGFVISTIVGFVHLLLAPLPWELRGGSLRMLCTVPELVFWWWLFFVCVIPGLVHSVRTRLDTVLPVLVFATALTILYSIIFGNIGLAFRQRAQLLPMMLILATVGLEQRLLTRHRERYARVLAAAES